MLVDSTQAQAMFDALPAPLRWPTLSPGYVEADARRDASVRAVFLVDRSADGLLMHAVHEAEIPDGSGRDWQSAYGYGGPIVLGLEGAALARAWQRLGAEAVERRVVAEFVRFHPALANQAGYPGVVRRDRAVVMIDLGVPDLLASYSGRARTAVRKAAREGLVARWETHDAANAAFPSFHRRSMAAIGASDFHVFGDAYFDALLRLPQARTLSVMQGDDRVAMAILLFGPTQVEYHLSGTTAAGRRCGATNLLLHTAAAAAQSQGKSSFYLGGGIGANEDDALLRFKASFAAPRLSFHFGSRVHDARAYQRLREADPARAADARVLFYRF